MSKKKIIYNAHKPIIIEPQFKPEEHRCHILIAPEEVCCIQFGKKISKIRHSIDGIYKINKPLVFYTCRGEMLTLDFDKKDRIVSIELLSSKKCKKPCMG